MLHAIGVEPYREAHSENRTLSIPGYKSGAAPFPHSGHYNILVARKPGSVLANHLSQRSYSLVPI
jgi:hypothetical protein